MKELINVVDVLRPVWTTSTKFESVSKVPAVSQIVDKTVFIHPKLRIIKEYSGGRIIIISAPGAVGKTTFAKYSTCEKKGFLWDLAKLKLGDNTFVGTLAKKFGSKNLSKVLEEFNKGNLAFFFDAFDEAEIISGWEGVENFVTDICNYSSESTRPNIVFFSRSETASLLQMLLEANVGTAGYSMFEIDYFDLPGAIQFVQEYLRSNGDTTFQEHSEPFIRVLNNIFSAVSHGMNGDEVDYWAIDDIRSFIGYSPVLQTIGSFLLHQNFGELAKQFENQKSETGGLRVIAGFIEKLLEREQLKVTDALKEKIANIPRGWDDWDDIYKPIEQIGCIVTYLFHGRRIDEIDLSHIPDWLRKDYAESLMNFLPNHPFLKAGEFSSPAFRDYSIARLLNINKYVEKCKAFFDKGNFVLTTLFAYFYDKFGEGKCIGPHVGLIYEAASSKKTIDAAILITFIRVQDDKHHIFEIVNPAGLRSLNLQFECIVSGAFPVVFERRLQNATIDVKGEVILGRPDGSIELSEVEINAERIVLRAKECILNCFNENIVILRGKSFRQEDYSLSLKKIGDGSVEVSWPNGRAHPWSEYYVEWRDTEEGDLTEELYALKRIFEPFRKHKKKEFAKQSEFIDNIIVSGNPLRQSLLDYLLELKIIVKNGAANQYLVDEDKLNSHGINWLGLKSLSMEANESLTKFLIGFKASIAS